MLLLLPRALAHFGERGDDLRRREAAAALLRAACRDEFKSAACVAMLFQRRRAGAPYGCRQRVLISPSRRLLAAI